MSANRCPPYRRAVARPKSPGLAPERARSTHSARVDADRSAEGQMSTGPPGIGSVERCNRVASQPFSRANDTGDASCKKEMRV